MNPAGTPSAPDPPDGALLASKGKQLRKLRILVVDDDPHVRTLMAAGIRRDGHEVQIASNSEWALALHARQPFDAVIVDLVMLGTGGLALGTELKRLNRRTPVILVTAHEYEFEHSPFDLILRKPVAHCKLRAALNLLCSPKGSLEFDI
jgi:DNA-binding NtrC family response regulator